MGVVGRVLSAAFLAAGALVAAGRAMDVEGLVIAAVLILAVVVWPSTSCGGPKRAANRLTHPMAVGVAWFRGRTDVPLAWASSGGGPTVRRRG